MPTPKVIAIEIEIEDVRSEEERLSNKGKVTLGIKKRPTLPSQTPNHKINYEKTPENPVVKIYESAVKGSSCDIFNC